MKKYEKLKKDDMVMKIPGPMSPGVFLREETVPVGACGIVLEGEDTLYYQDDLMVPYTDYGCYVEFNNYPSFDGGGWFINRPRLLKIDPKDGIVDGEIDVGAVIEIAKSIAETEKEM